MSSRKRCATCGRCTLTTTSSPVRSRAACTWAIEAAAMGVSSNDSNSSSSEPPRSISTTARTSANGSGRHLVAQQLELVDQLVGEEALAAGDDLAELHVARTEPFEREPQATGDARHATTAGATRRRSQPAERAADLDQGAAEPAEGREPARREEPGHLAAGAAPDAVDVPLPRDGVEIEHPRPVVAERARTRCRGTAARRGKAGSAGDGSVAGGIDGLDGDGHRQENATGTPRLLPCSSARERRKTE